MTEVLPRAPGLAKARARSSEKAVRLQAWTDHGGRIDAARLAYPTAPTPWLDLSTGINPLAWCGMDLGAIDLTKLPEPARLAELEAAAGAMFGCDASRVSAVPGTETGLRSLGLVDLPQPFRYVSPAYSTHTTIFPHATAISFESLETEAARGGTIVIANPNNPDGRVVAAEHLVAIGRILRDNGGWLVVDEAFADTVPVSVMSLVGADEPIIIMRSFGKFFGLAGLRLGFVIAPRPVQATIRRLFGSWPVSSPAIAIGTAAYRDAIWIAETRASLIERSTALDVLLSRHGLTSVGACPLFRLVETPAAGSLFETLARSGILTRPFDYAPTWLRFGVPCGDAALSRLDRALAAG